MSLNRKIVHEEVYKDHIVKISAEYKKDYGIKVNGEWYYGRIDLHGEILDNTGNYLTTISNDEYRHYENSKYAIMFHRQYIRYGFMKLRKEYSVIHISDEYERVFPLFLDRCHKYVDNVVEDNAVKLSEQEITDGLPDSLKEL
ncbi:hypothetical protein [Lederbergia lenta]|uniref:hypothetical protein n=1 Tax=Lederbergia lenta TaxID=1467 RepID=UPI0020403DF4|nr:hypothetical protein [Lederbergia lenta]MCM3109898.1 hypothetical protein [Lederbergia lenta]